MDLPQETLYSVEALAEFLLAHVDQEVVDILKSEQITGQTLTELNEGDLKELNIKMGPRKRLMQLIRETKKNSILVDVQELISEPNSSFFGENEIIVAPPTTETSFSLQEEVRYKENNESIPVDLNVSFDDTINVKEWLKNHPDGIKLIPVLERGTYSSSHRTSLVRIVVAKMIAICGDAYPSSEIKEKVAKGIIEAFPALQSQTLAAGHLSFYDPSTRAGFIEFRLKTIRKCLSPSKKKRKQKIGDNSESARKIPCLENLLNEEDLQERILWMQHALPDEHSKIEIISALNATRANRQMEIQSSCKTITDILQMYPRLKDFKGEMIDREYRALYPDHDKFLVRFTTQYGPRILKYLDVHRIDLLDTALELEDNLRALVLLPELLPMPNYGRGKGKKGPGKKVELKSHAHKPKVIPNPSLLRIVSASEDILSRTAPESEGSSSPVQPFLIMAKSANGSKCFIRVDNTLIAVNENPLRAFDTLFKTHYVFQVQYDQELSNFYNFIEGCIQKLRSPTGCCDALNTSLMNLKF